LTCAGRRSSAEARRITTALSRGTRRLAGPRQAKQNWNGTNSSHGDDHCSLAGRRDANAQLFSSCARQGAHRDTGYEREMQCTGTNKERHGLRHEQHDDECRGSDCQGQNDDARRGSDCRGQNDDERRGADCQGQNDDARRGSDCQGQNDDARRGPDCRGQNDDECRGWNCRGQHDDGRRGRNCRGRHDDERRGWNGRGRHDDGRRGRGCWRHTRRWKLTRVATATDRARAAIKPATMLGATVKPVCTMNISNQAGATISDRVGATIGDQSGTLISNPVGSTISNQAGARIKRSRAPRVMASGGVGAGPPR
jgi:hypothetical protein